MKNDVQDVVLRPEDKYVVTSKWIYKIKHAANGSIEKYKEIFVARGFSQKEGIYYEETFALVSIYTSIRSVLCENDVDSLQEIDTDSSCEDKMNNVMLMAIEYFENEHTGSDLDDEEAMVDTQGELINDLEQIDRLTLKKRKQKKN